MQKPLDVLKQYYGYDAFRPMQAEIIEAVLSGRDTLALLPTGGGKSVCYQVPALCMQGLCLVITPLIALMKDQVMQLRRRNISALAIHSGMAFFEVKKALQNAASGQFRFLFVSPERLETNLFQEYLPGLPISLLAVDEAHCISQWGYDFRPPYLRIANLRRQLDEVHVIALTASATPEVQQDICLRLAMQQPAVFVQSFARPNLSFSALASPHRISKLADILQKVPGSALVYCRNRKMTREISEWLQQQGISATFYHAGLPADERNLRQEAWIRSQQRVMVCTNAFGMGIDKPDVRLVVHIGVPESLEDYYQEAGRAGRDGKKAFAVLLYTTEELTVLEANVEKKYPDLPVIQSVYQAIANYLQLPAGSGKGNYYNFNLQECCERFKLDPVTTVNVLSTLSAEGYLTFNESVVMMSKVGFACSKDDLYGFEQEQPAYEPLLKLLLRTYEGIFDNEVNISETTLGRFLRVESTEVVKQLHALSHFAIISYTPRKDTPQLFFLAERVSNSLLNIDQKSYEARKARHLQRVRTIIRYTAGHECRSLTMQKYFGENNAEPCGKCDVCLYKKRQLSVRHSLLLELADKAKLILQETGPVGIDILRRRLGSTQFETEQLVNFALAEALFLYNEDGQVYLNG